MWFSCIKLISPSLGSVDNNKSIYYLILVDLLVILLNFLHASELITVLRFRKDYNSNIKPKGI